MKQIVFGFVFVAAVVMLALEVGASERSTGDSVKCLLESDGEHPGVYHGQEVPFDAKVELTVPTALLSPSSSFDAEQMMQSVGTILPDNGDGVVAGYKLKNYGYFDLVASDEDMWTYKVYGMADGSCLSLGGLVPTPEMMDEWVRTAWDLASGRLALSDFLARFA